MMRGFLSGAIWGTAIAALGLGTVSELLPLPAARIEAEASRVPRPKPAPVEPAAQSAAEQPAKAQPAAEQPAAEMPGTEEPGTEQPATTQPTPDPVQPGTTGPATEAIEPPAGSEFAKPLPDLDPVLPAAEIAPAVVPATEATLTPPASDPVSATDQPAAAPKTGLEAPTPLEPVVDNPQTGDRPSPETTTKTATLVLPGEPKLPQADLAPVPTQNPAPPEPAEVLLKPLPEILPVPDGKVQTKPSGQLQPDPALVPAENPPAADAPKVAGRLEPTPGLTGKVNGVVIGRLPRIGDAAPVPEGEAASVTPPDTQGDAPDLAIDGSADLPPLQKYARVFENPDNKPLFSVILIDTGEAGLDRTALAAIPFPVSFVLDPLAPDVGRISKIYRDAGQEVIMVATGIPDGATASDLEVTFQSNASALPEAVAVIDTEFGAFQANRLLATEVVPILKAQGRGLISWDRGLNAADQVARRDGLASGMVFRKLDGKGENTAAVRRALDRAAFKAAQDGRVMVIGQTLPATVAALMEWSVEGRAASVALAPVSAVLTAE